MKKGMLSMEIVIKYILAFAAFFVLALFIANFLGIIGGQGTEQACRTSVLARHSINKEPFDHVIPLNCPIQDKTIPTKSLKKLELNESREVVEEDIADLVAKCWWMYGNGQVDEIFSDQGNRRNPDKSKSTCAVCYTFYIPTSYGNDDTDPLKKPITRTDFEWYLATHNYAPGLLQGGGALPVKTATYNFFNQSNIPTSFTRTLTRERLFASRRSLEGNIADLTNIYQTSYTSFTELEDYLQTINDKGLQMTFVIVPKIEGENFHEYNNLAVELLDQWDLGTPDLSNGMVFIFSLEDGVLLYAAQSGAEAALPQSKIEEIIASSGFTKEMEKAVSATNENPGEAIRLLAKAFSDYVQDKNIKDDIAFQKSYLSYVTGGLIEREKLDKQKVKTNIQGLIRWSTYRIDETTGKVTDQYKSPTDSKLVKEDASTPDFAISPGYRYAIVFFSSDFDIEWWQYGWFLGLFGFGQRDIPPSIGIVFAQEVENDDYCKVYNK